MTTITRLLLLAAFLFFSTINFGQTRYYVNAAATGAGDGMSWGGAFTNLQNALAASQYGDEIWVAQGTYYPTTGTNRSISFNLKNGIKMFGGFMGTESSLSERDWASNTTILSGDIGVPGDSTDNSYNVIFGSFLDSTTVLDGFTITGGNAGSVTVGEPTAGRTKSGGALYLANNSSAEESRPIFRNCRFSLNYASQFGGAVYARSNFVGSTSPYFQNCDFSNNKARNGGALYKQGGSFLYEFKLDGCKFNKNIAFEGNGAGIYFNNDFGNKSMGCYSSQFIGNSMKATGGGIYIEHTVAVIDYHVKNCRFEDNKGIGPSSSSSAVLGFVSLADKPNLVFDSCLIKNNGTLNEESIITNLDVNIIASNCSFISNHLGGFGVFESPGSDILIWNCKFSDNIGDVSIIGRISSENTLELINTTVVNNTCLNTVPNFYQYLIINNYFLNPAIIIISNCIISGNDFPTNAKAVNGIAYLSNTLLDVPDCSSFSQDTTITCGPNMLYNLSPQFLDPAAGDFRLSPCSPARNAGSNTIVDSLGILTDIEGSPRIQGGTVDMGAYESPAFQATDVTVTSQACPTGTGGPGGLGTATLTLENGCPPYFLNWNSPSGVGGAISDSSLATLSLPVGPTGTSTHAITVTDGRMESDTISVTIGTAPGITGSANATNIVCGSGTGGSASIEAVGGTGTFSFLWSSTGAGNVGTTATVSNLPADTYTVTVTDANGCTLADTVTVGITGSLPVGISISPITCAGDSDGTATLQPIGGAMPFTWLWQGGQTTPTLDSLSGGSYSATVTDALGCTGDIEFTITPPTPVSVSIMAVQPLCFGELGFATANGAGGTGNLHYLWDNGATTASTMLSEGPHSVTVTDANGCSTVETVSIQAPPQLQLSLAVEPDMLCFGASNGSIIVTASGGSGQYGWSGPTENLSAGTYTITITDSNGCMATASATIAEHPEITVADTVTDASSPTATDGSVVLNSVTGGTGSGYLFSWSLAGSVNVISTEQNLTGVPTGDYSLTVTDSQGCTAVFNFFVDFNSAAGEAAANPFGAAIVPNPSGKAGASVLLKANTTSLKISVFDAVGKLVIAEQASGSRFALPKGLAAGSYRIVLENGKDRMVLNWVVGE